MPSLLHMPRPPPPPLMHAVHAFMSRPDGHCWPRSAQNRQSWTFAGHAPPPEPEPEPPPQSFGHEADVSPVSHVPLPQMICGLLLPPLPQSGVQLPTSLAAHTLSPHTGAAATDASGPVPPPPPSSEPPLLQPAIDAQTNTRVVILIMRGIVLMPSTRSTPK